MEKANAEVQEARADAATHQSTAEAVERELDTAKLCAEVEMLCTVDHLRCEHQHAQ